MYAKQTPTDSIRPMQKVKNMSNKWAFQQWGHFRDSELIGNASVVQEPFDVLLEWEEKDENSDARVD